MTKFKIYLFCFNHIIFNLNSITKGRNNSVIARASSISISTTDGSVNQRLRYYEQGLTQFLKTPFLGVGIGNWKLISIEYDKSFMPDWEKYPERRNRVIWDDAFSIDYCSIGKQIGAPKRINYLSCDIEPPENTFNILKKIIDAGLVFDFISFEHDKYNEGNKYDDLSYAFLSTNDYKLSLIHISEPTRPY